MFQKSIQITIDVKNDSKLRCSKCREVKFEVEKFYYRSCPYVGFQPYKIKCYVAKTDGKQETIAAAKMNYNTYVSILTN